LQSDLGLNESHQKVVMNYMKFARYQRIQSLKAIEYAFKDVSESRYCMSFFFRVAYVLGRGIRV